MITGQYMKFKLNCSVHTVGCCVMTLYNLVGGYQFVGGTRCILEIAAIHSSETFLPTYQITRYHNLEDDIYESSS